MHHPFHLHGYEFKVFTIGQFLPSRNISRADIDKVIEKHTERLQNGEYENPPGKDTVKIPLGGYAIIRFKANNPGNKVLNYFQNNSFPYFFLFFRELDTHLV